MPECKHEVHNGALDMLRAGKCDRVQCAKCKEALTLEQTLDHKPKKKKEDEEPVG